jgi:hypothetical protein
MRTANIFPLAAIPLAALAGWIAARATPQAGAAVPAAPVVATATAQMDDIEVDDEGVEIVDGHTPRIYFRAPMSAEGARTWIKLQQKVPMNFPKDTPLEDVLKYVRSATVGREKGDGPIPIYVDPIGLQEAEKTMKSPVALEIEGVPLATSLRLALRPLNLMFFVQKDGLLIITCTESKDLPLDAPALVLDRLWALEKRFDSLQGDQAKFSGQVLRRLDALVTSAGVKVKADR